MSMNDESVDVDVPLDEAINAEGGSLPSSSQVRGVIANKRRKTSACWTTFAELPLGPDMVQRAKCRKCGVILKCGSALGTRSLLRHHNSCSSSDTTVVSPHSATCSVMDLPELPEGCIAHIISLTSPRDACLLSVHSKTFKSAADSDAVWDKFLPPKTFGVAARSKKEVYLALSDLCPVLFNDGKMSFSLDKWSGKKCYMISARELGIVGADDPRRFWRWISHPESRFAEVAELLEARWLEIHGKLETRLLSPSTLYKGYLVFKFTAEAYGMFYLPAEVTMGLEGSQTNSRTKFLNSWIKMNGDQYPKVRSDRWLEIEMGEFFCEGRISGMLNMHCSANGAGDWKSGLIVQGIEVRPNRQG